MFVSCRKTLISCGFAGLSLCEAGSPFELFYRKAPPLQSTSIETAGFSRNTQLRFHLEKAENCYRKIYPSSQFRHRFLIKPVSFPFHRVPQIGQATCMPASDGAAAHYRKGFIWTYFSICKHCSCQNRHIVRYSIYEG